MGGVGGVVGHIHNLLKNEFFVTYCVLLGNTKSLLLH